LNQPLNQSLNVQIQIQVSQEALVAFCEKWQIQELAFFGSVLRTDFRADSDVDVLVSFKKNAAWGLLEFVRMKRELEQLLGREVDLLTKKSIEQSHNWIRRQEILKTAQVVYVAG
jgi:predicted nucleotidyltransferase